MNTNTEHCVKVCNSLLRGELSAVETYSLAIVKHPNSAVTEEFRRIRTEHSRSAARLSANIRDMGAEPDKDSGAWGIFATAVQATANLFGPESALESLQRGESMGLKDYQEALLDDGVMDSCKIMIREELVPRVQEHLALLETFEQAV